jgi:CheY-like chemotaxis protein
MKFTVIDEGIGLLKDEIKKIFDPFVQADNSITRQFGGTGLGLSISQQLATLLGGHIECESKYGQGSIFTFKCTIGGVKNIELITELPLDGFLNEASSVNFQLSKFSGKILIAEDNSDNRLLLKILLEKLGANVILAENGQQAMDRAIREDFDLIFMDVQMPIMDGLAATSKLRELGYTNAIVALTANALCEDRDKCLSKGCNDCITKPVELKRLHEILTKYLISIEGKTHTNNLTPV